MQECITTQPFYVVLTLVTIGVLAQAALVVRLSRMLADSEKLRIEAEYDAKRFKSERDSLEKKLMD